MDGCATPAMPAVAETADRPPISTKLWLYTNFDCNLRCSCCGAESTPETPRRALGLSRVGRLGMQARAGDLSRQEFT